MKKLLVPLLLSSMALSITHAAEEPNADAYREMTYGDRDANPALLVVDRGEELFKEKRGPNKVSLEDCDFGLGKGVVKGAYAQLPRYFKDTDRVQDAESRLITCMTTLQGFDAKELTKKTYANEKANEDNTDLEALTVYIAAQSDGVKINAPTDNPKEQEAIKVGEALFWRRQGPLDFSCASCHSGDKQRIRLQNLGNFSKPGPDAQKAIGSWPTYRVSHSAVRTMQHRIWDCEGQMRLPDTEYGSPLTVALISYLTAQAKDGTYVLPGMSR
jgi:sulfur-oxidizing protein SoxA